MEGLNAWSRLHGFAGTPHALDEHCTAAAPGEIS
jgi:hypothetical protein